MRLTNPEGQYSKESGGASAEVVDKLLGTAERKRARPASSLDVKVTNGDNMTRPPKKKKQSQKQQQKQLQQYYESRQYESEKRARGGARNKYDFSELDGLSEEEIMQALYDDPEMAAAAAEAAEKMQRKKDRTQKLKTESTHKRSRTVSEHPAHLKAMMDEGVPVKQWIILLVLLGAGLWQLRKAIVGSKKTGTVAPKKVDKPVPRKGGGKKNRKERTTTKSRSAPVIVEEQLPVEQELLVEEVAVAAAAAAKKQTINKKKKVRKPKAKKQQAVKETVPHESPDSISTDGSSSTDEADVVDDHVGVAENVIVDISAPVIDNDAGWQTVGAAVPEVKAAKLDPPVSPDESDTLAPVIGNDAECQTLGAAVVTPDAKAAKIDAPVTPEENNDGAAADDNHDEVAENVIADISAPDVDNDAGWKTVGAAAATPDVKAASPAKIDAPVLPKESDDAAVEEPKNGKVSTTPPGFKSKAPKKKKSSAPPQETPSTVEDDPEETNSLDGDEALALKLQLEEEKLVEHEANKAASLDIWEEVSLKKKKK